MSVNLSARSGGRIEIFFIFFNMKIHCVFLLESPHQADSNEYTQYTIFNIKKRKHANTHHWRKFLVNSPQIAPATPGLFSLLLPWLYLAGNQKPFTTIALLGQGEGKIMVLKPRSPQHFPGPGAASAANDCCIKMAHQACMDILNIETIQSFNSVLVTLILF